MATVADGSPAPTSPDAAAPAIAGGVNLPPSGEKATSDASRTAAPPPAESAPVAAFAERVLPCDAFFSLHGNESSVAGGWTFRLPDAPQGAENLAVSAAALAFLFSGVPDKRADRDEKRNRLAWQA